MCEWSDEAVITTRIRLRFDAVRLSTSN